MKNIRIIIVLILLIPLLITCNSGKKSKEKEQMKRPDVEDLIEMNKSLLNSDIKAVEEYISDNQLGMKKSGTGLFYKFISDVEGEMAASGKIVHFTYNIRSLEGDLYYSSNDQGVKSFEIGKSEVESGWNEAAKLMSKGDSLIMILPPHLAFRNVGDGNKIGAGKILLYELRLDSM